SLRMWFDVATTSCSQFQVDGTDDPVGTYQDTIWAPYASGGGVGGNQGGSDGHVPGFIGDGQTTSPLELSVYGFPELNRHLLFHVRHAGTSSNVGVILGASNPNTLLGSCRLLSAMDLGTAGPVPLASMGHATLSYQVPNS